MENWLTADVEPIVQTVATVFIIYLVVILYVRVAGLRTFAKMSSIDFASTIAIGSIIASVILNGNISILRGAVALGAIIFFQQLFAGLKVRSDKFEALAENSPTLLMEGADFRDDNMRKAGITRADVIAKLREANVTGLAQIKAVILETTGDISVLHGTQDGELPPLLLEGVVR